jgi:hypothetical protein
LVVEGETFHIDTLNSKGVVIEGSNGRRAVSFGQNVQTAGRRTGFLMRPATEEVARKSVIGDWLIVASDRITDLDDGGMKTRLAEIEAGLELMYQAGLRYDTDLNDIMWLGNHANWPLPRGHWRIADVREWSELGRTGDELRYVMTGGIDPNVLRPWFGLRAREDGLLLSISEVLLWNRAISSPAEAQEWIELGLGAAEFIEISGSARKRHVFSKLNEMSGDAENAFRLACSGLELNDEVDSWFRNGRSAAELSSWISAGVSVRDADEWLSVGLNDPTFVAWMIRKGVQSRRVVELKGVLSQFDTSYGAWLESNLGREEVQKWILLGFENPTVAMSWANRGISALEAEAWFAHGVREINNVVAWRDMGYTVAWNGDIEVDVRMIQALGDVVIAHPARWMQQGFAPSDVALWANHGVDIERAMNLRAMGLTASRVVPLVKAGLTDAVIVDWVIGRPRWSPDVVLFLHESGVAPEAVEMWAAAGFRLRDVPQWDASGLPVEVAQAWYARSWTPTAVKAFVTARVTPEVATSWRECGISLSETLSWVRAGITDVGLAMLFGEEGVPEGALYCLRFIGTEELRQIASGGRKFGSRELVATLRTLAPRFEEWEKRVADKELWVFLAELCNHDVDLAARLVAVPDLEIDSSLATLGPMIRQHPNEFFAMVARGVPFAAIRAGVRSGQNHTQILNAFLFEQRREQERIRREEAARAQQLAREEMKRRAAEEAKRLQEEERKRAKEASARRASPARRERAKWLTGGGAIPGFLEIDADGGPIELVDWLCASGWVWSSPSTFLFSTSKVDREEWLAECQSRALSARAKMRKIPHGVKVFEGEEILIALQLSEDNVFAWVGDTSTNRGVMVGFREEDFARLIEGDCDIDYALGLAISWYVDCCVSLVVESSKFRHSFEHRADIEGARRAVFRYVPTPSYRTQVESIRTGRVTVPRGCWVQAHKRHLEPGKKPNPEKVAAAPKQLRRIMGPRDTWVVAHYKQGSKANEVIVRLSRHSALGDAIGLANRGR